MQMNDEKKIFRFQTSYVCKLHFSLAICTPIYIGWPLRLTRLHLHVFLRRAMSLNGMLRMRSSSRVFLDLVFIPVQYGSGQKSGNVFASTLKPNSDSRPSRAMWSMRLSLIIHPFMLTKLIQTSVCQALPIDPLVEVLLLSWQTVVTFAVVTIQTSHFLLEHSGTSV